MTNFIEEYNEILLRNNTNITIKDYIKHVAEIICNYDVSFIDKLLGLLIKKEIHIHHDNLEYFGVLTKDEKLKKVKSGNVKQIIDGNNFRENIDYLMLNVKHQHPSGTKYSNEYYFHPDAFGIILMRAKNEKDYSKYYTLCQTCIHYHSEYQLKMKQTETSRLIDELKASNKRGDKLEAKLDKQKIR